MTGIGREMPHSSEAEMSFLGSVLLRPRILGSYLGKLLPGHFYRTAHRTIYEAMVRLYNEREAIDVVTVTTELDKKGQLESTGGVEFLSELSEVAPTSHNAPSYAKIIAQHFNRRCAIEEAYGLLDEAYSNASTLTESLNTTVDALVALQADEGNLKKKRIQRLGEQDGPIERAARKLCEEASGNNTFLYPTGLIGLDRIIGGFGRKELNVLAGPSSHGKTSLAMQIAFNYGAKFVPCLVVSIETTDERLGDRLIFHKLRKSRLEIIAMKDQADVTVGPAIKWFDKTPVYISDESSVTIKDIYSLVHETKSIEPELFFVVVDYLQLVKMVDKNLTREQRVATVARGLLDIAKNLDVCVLALSQLNRDRDKRGGNAPVLSDLRESAELEHASQRVLMIWQPQRSYEKHEIPLDLLDVAEIIVRKNKDGPIGSANFRWEENTFTLYDPVPDYHERETEQEDLF